MTRGGRPLPSGRPLRAWTERAKKRRRKAPAALPSRRRKGKRAAAAALCLVGARC
jgi:hypothetical protein